MKDYFLELANKNIKDIKTLDTDELRFVAKYIGLEKYKEKSRDDLISEIEVFQTKETINKALYKFDSLNTRSLTSLVFDLWFRAYNINRRVTILTTVAILISFSAVLVYLDFRKVEEEKIARSENEDLNRRLSDLESVENTLKDLSLFIQNQKEAIINTELSIRELEKEKDQLEPIVETQKETIEAIFRQQENRQNQTKWIERLFGFLFGVVASLVASFIYGFIKRKSHSKNVN